MSNKSFLRRAPSREPPPAQIPARALGWLGLALGLAALAMHRQAKRRRPIRTLAALAMLGGVAWLDRAVGEAGLHESKKRARHEAAHATRTPPEEAPHAEDSRRALTSAVAGAAS